MRPLKLIVDASIIAIILLTLFEIFRIGKMVNKLNDRIYTLEIEMTSRMFTGRVGDRVE